MELIYKLLLLIVLLSFMILRQENERIMRLQGIHSFINLKE